MSSMFKKKAGVAFKPKIPSARPRLGPTTSTEATKHAKQQETSNRSTEATSTEQSDWIAGGTDGTASIKGIRDSTPDQPDESTKEDIPSGQIAPTVPQGRQQEDEGHNGLDEQKIDAAQTEGLSTSDRPPSARTVEPPPLLSQDENSTTCVQILAPSSRDRKNNDHDDENCIDARQHSQPSEVEQANEATSVLNQESQATSSTSDTTKHAETSQQHKDTEAKAAAKPSRRRKSPGDRRLAEATNPQPRKRKARAGNDTTGPIRRHRARSLTPEDAESQVVDLQTLRMGDLTRDLHIGKKFSRHDELRDRERGARLKARVARNSDPPDTEIEGSGLRLKSREGSGSNSTSETAANSVQVPASGPQFRIVDGQIVVDQKSLVMDRHARAAAAQAGQEMETVEENDFTRLITSSSFLNNSKLRGPNVWTKEETELFYRGLRMFGTEFEMISKMFPGKQRRHVKLKFNREERHCPERIDAALIGEKTIKMDIEEYKVFTGGEFEPVEAIESEQRQIQEGFEAERQRIADEQEEIMRKKREALFADDETGGGKRTKGAKKKGKQAAVYGLNGEPIQTES